MRYITIDKNTAYRPAIQQLINPYLKKPRLAMHMIRKWQTENNSTAISKVDQIIRLFGLVVKVREFWLF
jgi:hypothetical protein